MPYRRKLAGKATRPSPEPHFHDYVVMVVLSVQNSVNLSVLKDWGLHPLDELATLSEVLEQFERGEIEPVLCSLMLSWSSRSSATSLQICLGRFRQFI